MHLKYIEIDLRASMCCHVLLIGRPDISMFNKPWRHAQEPFLFRKMCAGQDVSTNFDKQLSYMRVLHGCNKQVYLALHVRGARKRGHRFKKDHFIGLPLDHQIVTNICHRPFCSW